MNARDSGRQVSLSFSGNQPLRDVLTEALSVFDRLALDAGEEARASIILEELLVNLYEHGGMGPDGAVRLSFDRAADSLRLELFDTGRPFDPRSSATDAEMPERGGGAGLNLVREWAKILSYEAGPQQNRLLLWIPLHRDGAP